MQIILLRYNVHVIYIYIYRERERERGRESVRPGRSWTILKCTQSYGEGAKPGGGGGAPPGIMEFRKIGGDPSKIFFQGPKVY